MSEDITLEKAQAKKKELEEKIFQAINQFSNETGLRVSRIELDHVDYSTMTYKDLRTIVNAKIEI